MFANRLGQDPRVIVTSTPRPTPTMRKLINDAKDHPDQATVVGGSTLENAANLAPQFLKHLLDKYEGTRLGAQELEGLLLEEVQGALWSRDMFRYVDKAPEDLSRIVVSVDPPGGHRQGVNAKCGIVAVGQDIEGLLYVLQDASGYFSPEQWASRAIELYDHLNADCIVAESNYGGKMVESTLRAYSAHPKFKLVTASRGKALRAEPVVNLYERGRVFHTPGLEELEAQQVSWVPPGQTEADENGVEVPLPSSGYSPDLIDALVWAITELALKPTRTKTRIRFTSSQSPPLKVVGF